MTTPTQKHLEIAKNALKEIYKNNDWEDLKYGQNECADKDAEIIAKHFAGAKAFGRAQSDAQVLVNVLEAKTKRSNYQWSSGPDYNAHDFKNEGSLECASEVLKAWKERQGV